MNDVFSTEFAGRTISLKANYVAAQADGAILATYGDTVVLVTAVSLKSGREGIDFMPLTVDYQEMTYAAGKFPGGFFKREGRLNEREVLMSRMIDRSIRPLFPKGYIFETQLVATLLSMDNENDGGVAAMLAASAALVEAVRHLPGTVAGTAVAIFAVRRHFAYDGAAFALAELARGLPADQAVLLGGAMASDSLGIGRVGVGRDSVMTGWGVQPVAAWGLPARYLRSPVETVALADVAALAERLVAFLGGGR